MKIKEGNLRYVIRAELLKEAAVGTGAIRSGYTQNEKQKMKIKN